MRGSFVCVLTCLAGIATSHPAGASLSIPWWTIDGGGTTTASGGPLRLSGTVGQPDAGSSSGGALVLAGGFWLGGTLASAVDEETEAAATPLGLFISPCVPNPFRRSTSMTIHLPEARPVEARIHDATGREVRRITVGTLPPGRHSISWDGTDAHDRRVACGIYLLQIRAGEDAEKRTLVLIR